MSKEKIQALDQKLSAQRTQWSDTIRGLARGLKKVDGMEQVIAEVLSSRQTCVDQIAYLNVKIKEQKTGISLRYREAYIRYYEYDYKLGEKQKEKFLEDNKLLYPGIGDPKMLLVLTNKINKTAIDFKKVSSSKNPTSEQYQKVIKTNLKTFKGIYTNLDTEDRERICNYIEELMDIVKLESSDGLLNKFMYDFDPIVKD